MTVPRGISMMRALQRERCGDGAVVLVHSSPVSLRLMVQIEVGLEVIDASVKPELRNNLVLLDDRFS
jgi:hypothetical protein